MLCLRGDLAPGGIAARTVFVTVLAGIWAAALYIT
jgi:hypothetical protein